MKKFWNFVSNMGYTQDLDPEEARRIKLLARLNFISFLVLLLYLIVEFAIKIHTFIPFLLIMISFVVIDLFLLYKKAYILAKNFCIVIVSICISFFSLFTGDTFSEALFVPLMAMPLVIFKNKRIAAFYFVASLILVVVIKKIQPSVEPLLSLNIDEVHLFRIINLLSAATVTYFITYYFKAANEEYQSKLIQMNQIVSEKNKEIIDSIYYARRIQRSLLTSEKYIEKSLNRLSGDKKQAE